MTTPAGPATEAPAAGPTPSFFPDIVGPQETAEGAPETPPVVDHEAEIKKWKALARKHEAEVKKLRSNGPAETAGAAGTGTPSDETAAERTRRLEAERRAETAERDLMRYRIGAAKGLPAPLIARLQGDDEDAMSDDADELLKLVRRQSMPVGRADGGAGGTSAPKPASFGDWVADKAGLKRG